MLRDTDSKVPLLSQVKIVQYTVGLVFIAYEYDALTLDPPGGGTKGLVALACLCEIFLVFTEVLISTSSNELEKFWSLVAHPSSRVTPENN
jgi:hypothetical protein